MKPIYAMSAVAVIALISILLTNEDSDRHQNLSLEASSMKPSTDLTTTLESNQLEYVETIEMNSEAIIPTPSLNQEVTVDAGITPDFSVQIRSNPEKQTSTLFIGRYKNSFKRE